MSRQWEHAGDEARNRPDGWVRVGYDADEQTYVYQNASGDYAQGLRGSQYGQLTRIPGWSLGQTIPARPRSPQLPAYSPQSTSLPTYSPQTPAGHRNRRLEDDGRPPAVTFDEILTRHPTQNNKPITRPSDRELQTSLTASMRPKRSMSLRAVFGLRDRSSSTEERPQRRPYKVLARSSTAPLSSYRLR